jgi:hypothetical protein
MGFQVQQLRTIIGCCASGHERGNRNNDEQKEA